VAEFKDVAWIDCDVTL